MADENHGDSLEGIAFKLMEIVFKVEDTYLYKTTDKTVATRKQILDTYDECLATVRGHREVTAS